MALSDASIRAAKPRAAQFKLHDEGGLLLIVRPSGGKLWRLKYRHVGKEQQLSIGVFPDVGLKEARKRRDEARKLIADGANPAFEKKRAAAAASVSAANTFKAVAEEFIAKREREGLKDITTTKARWLLDLLEPALGQRPIAEIEPYELLAVLKRVELSGRYETAKRLLAFSGRVFRYAVATTRAKHNAAADLQGALVSPKVKHHAAIIDPKGVGALLRAIEGFEGHPTTKWALRLAPHVFVRPGELRRAEWSEIDLDKALWRIPGSRMKMNREHVVPLSHQAVAILEEARQLTGDGRFVFPSVRTPLRPMSENTLNAALRRLGYSADEMTSHGFRSTASTLLNESGKWSVDAIERALAHGDTDTVRAAYHRGAHWQKRVKMAQWWSDYLDGLKEGGKVIPMKRDG
ncbi:MAG TPA: integrase arm-type DNA-binding domain-containing protein [Gemmatimonadales bacterium]|nr:integrase arm-type DNA-binding domain-containing protein [Gemmatimonadales bacterium]